jgi:radical SAM protein with 4Fe4S-binding SPASM domain
MRVVGGTSFAEGTVAQCDCWVTSLVELSYPNTFLTTCFSRTRLTRMLKISRARRDFVERPKRLVSDDDCLFCRFLSICHAGCPVRTYSALGTMHETEYFPFRVVTPRSVISTSARGQRVDHPRWYSLIRRRR